MAPPALELAWLLGQEQQPGKATGSIGSLTDFGTAMTRYQVDGILPVLLPKHMRH